MNGSSRDVFDGWGLHAPVTGPVRRPRRKTGQTPSRCRGGRNGAGLCEPVRYRGLRPPGGGGRGPGDRRQTPRMPAIWPAAVLPLSMAPSM